MIIGSKFSGYSRDNRRLYHMDGGGSSAPAKQTQIVDLPSWAKPYAKETLGKAQALTDINQNPYQSYGKERIAGFTPLQQQSFQNASQMQPSQLGSQAGQLAGAATMGALGTGYSPFRMGQFTSERAGQYMNPFVEQAMEPQLREAQRSSEIQKQSDLAGAARAGAFGGSRQAIVEAERQRNLGTQLGDIRAKGYATAFDQAQQNFAREQQLREQSRQYGAGLGLQGLQTALQGAGQMGQLGNQQFQQGIESSKLQNLFGAQQQQLEQQGLSQQYQDFQNQQRYPYQQLEFMSNILRGTPMGTVQTLYGGQPNNLGTLAGLGIGAYGALSRAEGGEVHSYAEGGVTGASNVEDIISKLSDEQLQQANQAAIARGDAAQMQMIAAEIAQRASMRRGIAAGIPDEFADSMDAEMAAGGIVAFAGGGDIDPLAAVSGNSAEALAMDELRRQSILERRNAESEAQRMEFLRESAPEVAARLEKNKASAGNQENAAETSKLSKLAASRAQTTDSTAQVKQEPKNEGSKETVRVAQNLARSVGVPERSMVDEAMAQYRQLQELSKDDVRKLNEIIEGQKNKAKEIKSRGISDALRDFGFAMAAKASQPGATFLGSAGAAAPVFSTTLAENDKAVQAAQDNYEKMRADQARYQIALERGDMASAQTFANNIRRDMMDQQRLAQLIKYQNRSLDIQATQANRSPDLTKIANDIMADPDFQGSKMDAYRIASGLQGGVDIRTEAANMQKANQEAAKATQLLVVQRNAAKTPAEREKFQAEIDRVTADIRAKYAMSGSAPGAASPATQTYRFDAKGNLIQ